MYVVGVNKRSLRVGKEIRKAGDPVPEADDWKDHILQAHLNLQWLMTEDQYNAITQAHARRNELLAEKRKRDAESRNAAAASRNDDETDGENSGNVSTEATGGGAGDGSEAPTSPLHEMTINGLRSEAKRLGLDTKGSKGDIIERIVAARDHAGEGSDE